MCVCACIQNVNRYRNSHHPNIHLRVAIETRERRVVNVMHGVYQWTKVREQIRKEYVYSRRRKQTNVKKKSAWIIRKIFMYKYIKK